MALVVFLAFFTPGMLVKPFVVKVFALPAMSNLLLEGPGHKQIYNHMRQSFAAAQNSECYNFTLRFSASFFSISA